MKDEMIKSPSTELQFPHFLSFKDVNPVLTHFPCTWAEWTPSHFYTFVDAHISLGRLVIPPLWL